jgi:hypothetical protein
MAEKQAAIKEGQKMTKQFKVEIANMEKEFKVLTKKKEQASRRACWFGLRLMQSRNSRKVARLRSCWRSRMAWPKTWRL